MRAFFDRYFPAKVAATTTADSADFAKMAQKYVGAYRFARHSSTKFEKGLVASPSIEVAMLPKERRLLVTGLGEKPGQFAPVGNGVFEQVEGHRRITFHRLTPPAPRSTWRSRISRSWARSACRRWRSRVCGTWCSESPRLIFLAGLLTAFYRRRENRELPREQKRVVTLSTLTAAWFFLTFIVMGLALALNAKTLFSHVPDSLKAALVMPIVFGWSR